MLNYIFMPSRHSHLRFLSHLLPFSVGFAVPIHKHKTAYSVYIFFYYYYYLICQVKFPSLPTMSLILQVVKGQPT